MAKAQMSDNVFGAAEVKVPAAPAKDTPMRQVLFWVSEKAHRQLKIVAMDLGRPQKEVLREALNDWFAKHKKPPIA